MKTTIRILCFVAVLLLLSTHRLPAPIQEEPTPAPKQSAKPKPKRTSKPKVTSESSESATKRQTPSPTPPSNPQTPQSTTSSSANTQGYDTVALRPSGSMSGPKPQVPEEARGQHLTGIGIYILHFEKPTGNLIDVTVSQSSGSTILDQGAIATLRQWHATPGCPREVPFTITYSVTGP